MELESLEKVPGAQAVHAAEPVFTAKVPGTHGWQEAPPPGLKFPGLQGSKEQEV